MPTTLINPQIEFEAAQRVRTATLMERAVHGAGEWTVQDGTPDLSIALEHRVVDGVPQFVGTYEGEDCWVGRFALCHDDDPVRWFNLNMNLTDGDEVTVDFT